MASTTYNPRNKEEHKGTEHHLEQAKDAGAEALNKAKEAGKEAFASVKEAGAEALDKAKGTVESVGHMATQAASAVGNKADDLTAAAGHELKAFGETVAQKAPHDGIAGTASQAVAEGIKGTGRYIEDAKLSGMAHDVEQVIKNHPIPALLICFGIGVCLGRAMKD
jgi:ElaB/YqjD/DUF883 family membrane-anchored ribosome-binding protein